MTLRSLPTQPFCDFMIPWEPEEQQDWKDWVMSLPLHRRLGSPPGFVGGSWSLSVILDYSLFLTSHFSSQLFY